jgi:hypothetical protein
MCSQRILLYTIGGHPVWQLRGEPTYFFAAGMQIDADGSPRAYGEHGKGLDALGNAGKPGHWWGIVTDTGKPDGKPVTQAPPLDDFYISPTALQDHRYGRTDPRRYVDSETVPYISLPGKGSLKGKHPNPDHRLHVFASKLGDLA